MRRPADEDLHMVRILAKRCRYAAEACTPSRGQTGGLSALERDPARHARARWPQAFKQVKAVAPVRR